MDLKEALDLDRVLGKARNFVYRVGIELEGGWKKLPDGARLAHDGSVLITPDIEPLAAREIERVRRQIQRQADSGVITARQAEQMLANMVRGRAPELQQGELPSEILELEKYPAWMKAYYPSHVNASCGLHVHQSFTNAVYYQRLMTPKYTATILKYVAAWAKKEGLPPAHPIWPRLAGKSEYCQHKFYADQQATSPKDHNRTRHGHRYTVVNYPHREHGTIEVRLLPMMEGADLGIRAVQNILDITNAFLHAYRQKEAIHREQITLRSGDERHSEVHQDHV